MVQLMEYKIISGRMEETRRAMMNSNRKEKVRRGQRVKGRASMAKIKANERDAVRRLARVLHCNFVPGDMWVTLTYRPETLPESIEAAKDGFSRFMRKVRRAFADEHGRNPRYVISTSHTDPDTGERVRVHHHLVMEQLAYEMVCQLWPKEDVTYRHLQGWDYTGVARYIISNAERDKAGEKKWSTSRGNMEKPVCTEPVPVRENDPVPVPRDAVILEHRKERDPVTGMYSEYVRYITPQKKPKKPNSRKRKRAETKKSRQRMKH